MFQSSPLTSTEQSPPPSVAMKGGAVWQWLSDLRNMTEIECMSVLQTKPLQVHGLHSESAAVVQQIRESIDVLKDEADVVSEDFAKLFKCLMSDLFADLLTHSVQMTQHLESLVHACNAQMKDVPVYVLEQQDLLHSESLKLVHQSESFPTESPERAGSGSFKTKIPLVNQLTFLGQSFSHLVDITLGHLVQKIVDSLSSGQGLPTVHAAISCIIGLSLEGEHMCFIIAREGGVRGLLDVCRRETLTFTRSQALRALATLCCAPECIAELEKERGMELLVELLCMTGEATEAVQGEAAGVVAQLTSPSVLHGPSQLGGLLSDLHRLLQSLLNLCQRTVSHEVFLLSAAAVANITFLHPQACMALQQLGAPQLLITAASAPKSRSLFAEDQVATVLANMAAQPCCHGDIHHHGGVELLIRFLHRNSPCLGSKMEMAACERVQQKAAIALSRLCGGGGSGQSVIHSKAVPRLVELCRNCHARNNSDSVLVACLAALRKICSVNGAEGLRQLDLQQLVLPQLMYSFLICSNAEENFV